uniref:Mon2/Sec7/BIG1-like HUS domain-containing protein n=1 Tax=Amphimedon queenslandica TaxID=400682 RepID=A0A1X7SL15_AMPQE
MLECGVKRLGDIKSLRVLMQDGLCHHLLTVNEQLYELLQNESVDVFGRSLTKCFLLFDSNCHHLKLQLEWFLNKLMHTIQLDQSRLQAGRLELTLECLNSSKKEYIYFCHIHNFVSELYVNYDCSTYCTNVCERLSKLLAKQAFPSSYHTISSTNIISNGNTTGNDTGIRINQHHMCTKINGGKVAGDCNKGVSVNSSAGIIFSSDKQQQPDISLNGAEKVGGAISECIIKDLKSFFVGGVDKLSSNLHE